MDQNECSSGVRLRRQYTANEFSEDDCFARTGRKRHADLSPAFAEGREHCLDAFFLVVSEL